MSRTIPQTRRPTSTCRARTALPCDGCHQTISPGRLYTVRSGWSLCAACAPSTREEAVPS
jgi:hypothetical protein